MTQQKAPKWLINFSRKDLVTASWGSSKGADLLYHFIHKASRESENRNMPETLKDISFQEEQKKIRELASLSVGSLHTYLKYFVSVGYVSNKAYSKDFTVHLDAIERAFSETPAKPEADTEEKPARKPRARNVSISETLKLVTLPLEELDKLYNKMFQLNDLFQSLNEKYSDLNEKYSKLCTLESSRSAQDANAKAFSDPLYDSVCFRDDSEFLGAHESENNQQERTSQPTKKIIEIDPLSEDLPEAQPKIHLAYSQGIPANNVSGDFWLQESSTATIDSPSQETVPVPEKPATAELPRFTSEPPRFNTKASSVAKERKEIERHIWRLIDTEAGAKIGRVFTQPMEDLVTSYMDGEYMDEDFIQSVQLVRIQKLKLTFTNIVNNMADAVLKRKKIIDFQQATTNKKSIDEQIEESRRAAREFDARTRKEVVHA